jgi:hypothetical protein
MLAKTIPFRRYSIAYMSILKLAKQKSHLQQKEDHPICSTFLQFEGPCFLLIGDSSECSPAMLDLVYI